MRNPPLLIDKYQAQLVHHIYRLRYDVLVTEQNKHPEYSDHTNKLLKEPLDSNSFLFASIEMGDVIGTCRVNHVKYMYDRFYHQHYRLDYFHEHNFTDQVGIVSRLILHPAYRGTTAFKLMVKGIFTELLNNALSVFIIDCTLALAPIYCKLGFLPYGTPFTHKDGMKVIPMILDANNPNRLMEINSVLQDCYPANFSSNEFIKNRVSDLVNFSLNKKPAIKQIATTA